MLDTPAPRTYLSGKMNTRVAGHAAGERELKGADLALKLWIVLSRAHASIGRHAERDIGRSGLTPTEFAVLEVLYHKGPLLLGEVQRLVLVSSGGVTYLVDRLERKGLVERRECSHDRRARYAALTPEGESLIGRIFRTHAACIEHATSGLDDEQKRVLIELLRTLGQRAQSIGQCPSSDG